MSLIEQNRLAQIDPHYQKLQVSKSPPHNHRAHSGGGVSTKAKTIRCPSATNRAASSKANVVSRREINTRVQIARGCDRWCSSRACNKSRLLPGGYCYRCRLSRLKLQLVTGVACGDKTARASVRAVDYEANLIPLLHK
jgi:hypothetical protein